jgi:sterol desaturase/sphingolipid hydroxylase (fatty acid hydroxylase superfamily)
MEPFMNDPSAVLGPNLIETAIGWFFQILPFEFGRYLVGAGGAFLLIVIFAAPLAGRKIRVDSPKRAQMLRELWASARTSAIFALGGVISVMGSDAGIMKAYDDPARFGWGYFWLSIGLLVVLHDAWFYWTHRLIHDPRLFRRFHRLHHKSHNPSPFTAYSFDVGEAAINAAFMPLTLLVLPVSEFAIFLFLAHMIVRNAVGHSGYELFPAWRNGRPIFDFLTTVTHHDLHHAQAGWNFGLYFTWWDRLMGTEHPLYHEKFAAAVRKPLDGSAVKAMRSAPSILISAALIVAATAQPPARAANASGLAPERALDAVVGLWATEGHGAHVALSRCEDDAARLCGRLVWSWDPAIAASQGDKLMLGDFRWNGDAFDDGWLANPEDGRIYRGKITLTKDGALTLKGCALVFCKSEVWRRLGDIPGCSAARAEGLSSLVYEAPPID